MWFTVKYQKVKYLNIFIKKEHSNKEIKMLYCVSHIRIVKKQAAWYHKGRRKRRGEIKKGSGNYVSEINDMSGKCKKENRFQTGNRTGSWIWTW